MIDIGVYLLEDKPVDVVGLWKPEMPSHHLNDQHENIGLDIKAAHNVVAYELGVTKAPDKKVCNQELLEAIGVSPSDQSLLGLLASDNLAVGECMRVYQATVHTGLCFQFPVGYHMLINPRSGMWFRDKIWPFNGVIDSCYTGEVIISLIQFTTKTIPFTINCGDRVAQGIIQKSLYYSIVPIAERPNGRVRGVAGFGSTGV